MRLFVLAAAAFLAAAPASAQQPEEAAPTADEAPVRVNQLIVYGDDACPPGGVDEIVVCARLPEDERFRIPEGLRDGSNDPANQSWTNRAIELSYVGRSGVGSCSPSGANGFIGCHNELVRQARAERAASGIDWDSLLAEARENRMRQIDREIEEIERDQAEDD